MDNENLGNGFYTDLAIDEEGPKRLLISEHDGKYTVNHDGQIVATLKMSGDDWEQVDGNTISPGAVRMIGEAISKRT